MTLGKLFPRADYCKCETKTLSRRRDDAATHCRGGPPGRLLGHIAAPQWRWRPFIQPAPQGLFRASGAKAADAPTLSAPPLIAARKAPVFDTP